MTGRVLAALFVIAALLPQAIASAQGSSTSSSSAKSSTTKSTSTKSTASSKTANAKNNANHKHKHNGNPWSNVYINAGNASQYMTPTSAPKPPGPNKVNTGGEVFKSISN